MPTQSLLLRLPEDVKTWLREDAARNERNMTAQVIAILRERMRLQEQQASKQPPAK